MKSQESFSFMKLNKDTKENKEVSLESKKKILEDATEDCFIASVDVLRNRKVSDKDFLRLINSIEKLNWALRSSDFDRMVYNEETQREIRGINAKLDLLLIKKE